MRNLSLHQQQQRQQQKQQINFLSHLNYKLRSNLEDVQKLGYLLMAIGKNVK